MKVISGKLGFTLCFVDRKEALDLSRYLQRMPETHQTVVISNDQIPDMARDNFGVDCADASRFMHKREENRQGKQSFDCKWLGENNEVVRVVKKRCTKITLRRGRQKGRRQKGRRRK